MRKWCRFDWELFGDLWFWLVMTFAFGALGYIWWVKAVVQ